MRKAISIEETSKTVARVLSIAEPEIIECNPTQNEYFIIEDYEEPIIDDPSLHKAYAVYDKVKKQFRWMIVKYTITAPDGVIEVEDLKNKNDELETQVTLEKAKREELENLIAEMAMVVYA